MKSGKFLFLEEKPDKKEKTPMKEDTDREYKDTMQEVMLDLKLKTDKLMERFKEASKKDKFKHSSQSN